MSKSLSDKITDAIAKVPTNYKFVEDNGISLSMLKRVSGKGIGIFCKLATEEGYINSCSERSKYTYVFYLTASGQFQKLIDEYNSMDIFEKAAMEERVKKGLENLKGRGGKFSESTEKKLKSVSAVIPKGCVKNYSKSELVDKAMFMGLPKSDANKMNKYDLCAFIAANGDEAKDLLTGDKDVSYSKYLGLAKKELEGFEAWKEKATRSRPSRQRLDLNALIK